MARPPRSPHVPLREGVSPSRRVLPSLRSHRWTTVLAALAELLPAVSPAEWERRMQTGQVVDAWGQPIGPQRAYENGLAVHYWRDLPSEQPVPFRHRVLHRDDHLLVVDKPHFLPVTPGGRHVKETLLVRLKDELNLPDLSPLHRLDRETAGLVALCLRPVDRNAYQQLFRERRVHKRYTAIARLDGVPIDVGWCSIRRTHVCDDEQAFYRMRELPGGVPNTETRMELVDRRGPWGRFCLEPVTGKRHQLRVHMAAMGLPLKGDQFYPQTRRGPDEAEDFSEPLQLLAQHLAFTDPVTGEARGFDSQLQLQWPD
jgi:tRNA pseudouridine32 synthase / 23S rRNA pseudouridine746 synthase